MGWMEGLEEYVVDSNMKYADIIVPTIDTVRVHFLLELLLGNSKPVSQQVFCISWGCFYYSNAKDIHTYIQYVTYTYTYNTHTTYIVCHLRVPMKYIM